MPSHGRAARALRPNLSKSSRIGSEQIDGYEHVALHRASADRLLYEQRTDAEQAPLAADQRRAAPLRMRGRGEQRLVEQILPVTGELALGKETCFERMRTPAMADDNHLGPHVG
jgi:hypothetical protein